MMHVLMIAFDMILAVFTNLKDVVKVTFQAILNPFVFLVNTLRFCASLIMLILLTFLSGILM